jgi:CubicO group peptidase (beta-lactamase class C family)
MTADGPGHVTAVVRRGEVVHAETAGLARIDASDPLTADSIFYVGSIAKQFVAACVALLERDGDLRVDAPIAAYVPRLPAWGSRVTIGSLIHHTAGVRERTRSGPGVPVTGVPGWGNEELLDQVRAIADLDFEPGTRYGYSNRGYLLLAEAVATAAGTSVRDYARERIFAPLRMGETFFRDAETPLPPAAARGHFRGVDGGIHVEPARFHAVGAGGLWTTVRDLARWDAVFVDDPLTDGWLPRRMLQRGRLNDGRPIHYAWGLSVRSHKGLAIVSHGGNFPGWESKMVRFPDHGITVIILANGEGYDASARAFVQADTLLAHAIDPEAPPAPETFDVA